MIEFTLRAWQVRFARQLLAHEGQDFLLVAAPAAGKTLGAGAAIAPVMAARGCDQVVVACPTVVVRDQWVRDLGRLGFQMVTRFDGHLWPEWVHGACLTYQQLALDPERYAQACENRPTIAICDEIHHAGESLAWGEALRIVFADAKLRLALSGTPFRSDQDAIPFVSFDHMGRSVPDFAYDYSTAVRDGVCRPIRFCSHDGEITWEHDGEEHTARFSQTVHSSARPRRLRASLDPRQPYLRSVLEAAHADLIHLRQAMPDAAGLVVCDSQSHAMEVDGLLNEISGSLSVLAMSDVPRSHEAILAFAGSNDPWLVSVRMVSEGVDIPRLGVIVWATAATTELMVRQVSGRALRGRAEYALLPAVVHMPADPELIRFAERLESLSVTSSRRSGPAAGAKPKRDRFVASGGRKFLDPTRFIEWFNEVEASVGLRAAVDRCGWSYGSGARLMHRIRREGCRMERLNAYDACFMAGIDFDEMFPDAGEVPERRVGTGRVWRAVSAEPVGGSPVMIDVEAVRAPVVDAGEVMEVLAPKLPPSPAKVKLEQQLRESRRGELLRQLSVYAQLRRMVDPAFLVAAAHRELAAEVGVVGVDASDGLVGEALAWVGERLRGLVREHPEAVRELAGLRRRQDRAVA